MKPTFLLILAILAASLQAQTFTVNIQISHEISCAGMSDGSLTAQVNPPGAYTFLWSNGATGSGITDVPAGAYSLSVQNASGESHLATAVLTEPAPLEMAAMTSLPMEVDSVGTVEVLTTGGTVPYAFEWVDENGNWFANTENLILAPAGTYTGTATDARGCTAVLTPVTLLQTSASVEAASIGIRVFPNPAAGQTTIEIPEGTKATLQLHDASGRLLRTEQLDNARTRLDLQSLPPGVYFAFVNGNFGATCLKIMSE